MEEEKRRQGSRGWRSRGREDGFARVVELRGQKTRPGEESRTGGTGRAADGNERDG